MLEGTATSSATDAPPVSLVQDRVRGRRIMERVMSIYDEALRQLTLAPRDVPLDALRDTAAIVQRLMGSYRASMENGFFFPRFRQVGRSVEAVNVLEAEHRQARRFTAAIARLATPESLGEPLARQELVAAIRAFQVVYRSHDTREDTVLLLVFSTLLSRAEADAIGAWVARQETVVLGGGYDVIATDLSRIEQRLGIGPHGAAVRAAPTPLRDPTP